MTQNGSQNEVQKWPFWRLFLGPYFDSFLIPFREPIWVTFWHFLGVFLSSFFKLAFWPKWLRNRLQNERFWESFWSLFPRWVEMRFWTTLQWKWPLFAPRRVSKSSPKLMRKPIPKNDPKNLKQVLKMAPSRTHFSHPKRLQKTTQKKTPQKAPKKPVLARNGKRALNAKMF